MIQVSSDACCGCAACANVCSRHCIEMKADYEGFLYPHIDTAKCVECGLCVKTCPVLRPKTECAMLPTSYIAYNSNPVERYQSSSGGVFALLAKRILEQKGVVFGAAFTDDCYAVHHIAVESIDELQKVMRSKYLQSQIGNAYKEVQRYLAQGRKVLFAGTPCQVEALLCLLGKENNNLICVDFVCHGVPSQKLWERYVRFRETIDGNVKVERVSFRDKVSGWRDFSMTFEYIGGKKYCRCFEEDLYGQAFVRNASLRKSCYRCPFRKADRHSDLTISDAWDADRNCIGMLENQGLSRVFIHTQKGKELFREMNELICIKESGDSACAALVSAPRKNPGRDWFYRHYMDMEFDRLVAKYAKPSLRKRMVYLLRKLGLLQVAKDAIAFLKRIKKKARLS